MKHWQLLLALVLLTGCHRESDDGGLTGYQPKPYVLLKHPVWSRNATIYEANIRQYTPEGTFRAFEKHLPRLKKMGIDIIWIMPVNPIGNEKRKGTLGSEYSVKDYYGINPEFGDAEDFRHLVKAIHGTGMHVILDWVANHSSWDNPLAKQHPEWYSKSPEGHFQPTPWYDWDDVIDFDYDKPALRKYMADAMAYWVKAYDIDGFRCDVAGFIPVDFWEGIRARLDRIKPVFMLAEWESRDLHRHAFDMTYSWSLYDKMKAAAHDQNAFPSLVEYMAHDVNTWPRDAYRMTFTDNHDKNSWEGNPVSNFGDALEAAVVLAGTVNGMPLVYSGQEAGLDRSLRFFDKDTIVWKPDALSSLYAALFSLKHRNHALWNGASGGAMVRIINDRPAQVLSFSRTMGGDKVVCVINYSPKAAAVALRSQNEKGDYSDLFTHIPVTLSGSDTLAMRPWGYRVLELKK
jgi:glycosidase